MSRDKSLRNASSLVRHRNVLTRAERIETLREVDKWVDGTDPYGLPKVAHRKVSVGGKTKKTETAEGTEGTEDAETAATGGEEKK